VSNLKSRGQWRRIYGISLGIFLLPLLAAAGCQKAAVDPSAITNAENPDSNEPSARVAAIKPQRKTLERRCEQPGEVVAEEVTPIYAKLAGYVQSVAVDIGDEVQPGQTLAILSVPEMDEELKQKHAQLTQAHAQVSQADSAVAVANAVIESAQAKVAAAEAAIAKTTADVQRWKSESGRVDELADRSAVTRKVADETLNALRAAEGAEQEAQAQVKSAQAMVRESQARLQAAESDRLAAGAKVDVAEADDKRTQALLDYAVIKAPYKGIVSQRNIHTGHFVQPATTGRDQPLFVVRHSDTVRVVVSVPESDAGFTNQGDPATIRVQALDNKVLEAPVTRTAQTLDSATRTLRTEIELNNASGELQPGMYCAVSILVEKRANVLVIPLAAVLLDQGKPLCAAIVDGRIVRKPLVLGLRAGNEVEVLSGLTEDDSIVPRNPGNFKEGQRVEIAK
jgi:HlyD family secretion protein